MIGQTLSHYRITAALGAGGMGEVYRATDTNLDRDVAIKVLPPEVAQDPERLARFKREAHLLAALNHPNIAAIYGLEEADGKPFLALELVEGEDLKQRLARGAIPVDEALEIAKQIAEALEEAHDKGIVHRDLKPANVKLTPDGKVKVLDFGLAKAWAGDAADGSSALVGAVAVADARAHRDDGGRDPGHRGLHVARAGAGQAGRQAGGRVVLRRAAVGDADRPRALRRRHGDRRDRGGRDAGAGPRRAAGGDAAARCGGCSRRCLRKDPRTRLPDIGAARLELQEVLAGAAGRGRGAGGATSRRPSGRTSAAARASAGPGPPSHWLSQGSPRSCSGSASTRRPSRGPPRTSSSTLPRT